MKTEVRRIASSQLEGDRYAYQAVQAIAEYKPVKKGLSINDLSKLFQELEDSRKFEVQKEGEFKAARDNAVKAEHAFHNAILEMKNQVRAQFGDDSNGLQNLGLKKKSEYKSPKRTSK